MAEQVYQTVKGNMTRAAGNAEAFSKGDYPPDVEVMDTPRTGITLTHRVGLQLNAALLQRRVHIPAPLQNPPSVNGWYRIFHHPLKFFARLPIQHRLFRNHYPVSQQEIGLDAMDLLYVLQTDTAQAMSEIDDRIVNHIRYNVALHPDTKVFIKYTETIDIADRSKVSLFELSALGRKPTEDNPCQPLFTTFTFSIIIRR